MNACPSCGRTNRVSVRRTLKGYIKITCECGSIELRITTGENNMENTIEINGETYIKAGSTPANAEGLRYAIVRSRDQGVMCGFVKAIEGRRVTLIAARQMWRWSSKFVLVDMAESGVTDKWESKFSCEASQPVEMLEACAVLYCTIGGMDSLRAVKAQDHA